MYGLTVKSFKLSKIFRTCDFRLFTSRFVDYFSYIIPVVLLSILLNIPKFMETKFTWDEVYPHRWISDQI